MRAAGDSIATLLADLPGDFAGWSHLAQDQYLEVRTLLGGYLMSAQGDRMLMGNSIEGRFPFLDFRLAEFAARLPDRLKLSGLREKYLLRKAVRALLPSDVVEREKRPYRAPILRAFVGADAPEYARALVQPDRLAEAGVFSPPAVARLMEKCRRNEHVGVTESDEMALVGVLSVMLLHEQMIARPRLAAPARPQRVVVGSTVVVPTDGHLATEEIEGAAASA
jgi:asparagine synthase (glutamine-hydrolysing)